MAGPYSAKDERALMTEVWDPAIADDLLAFVMFMFPWGKENTPLHNHKGPKAWQREDLEAMTDHIRVNKQRIAEGKEPLMYREATVSGRGPGKSAKFAWLIYWMMSTRLGGTVVVTANTEAQLKTRTWAELGKWHTLALNRHWFDRQTLTLRPAAWFDEALKKQLRVDTGYYYAAAQLWSEENPDSFAGVHNPLGVMVLFDEASGIPSPIWTVTEGFFTEPVLDRYWLAASNGRRNTGDFFECFHKHREHWRRRQLDARTVEGAALEVLNGIVAKYGEDSDEARVEVKGQFPKQGENQLIGRDTVEDAQNRPLPDPPDIHAPLIMGVDVGRGGDPSVIRWRHGRDARSIPVQRNKVRDNMEVAHWVADWIDKTNPDAVCIDAGNGTGVIDRLRGLKYKVNEVWFGSKSPNPAYADLRTYMWFELRDWLTGACVDVDQTLYDDLVGPEKRYVEPSGIIRLESKPDMHKRGLASPNDGDALALTFAVKVNRKDRATASNKTRGTIAPGTDYDMFGTNR